MHVDVQSQGGSPEPTLDRVLTSSEQILAASDRPSAPLTCGFLVQTVGTLDVERLRFAVREATRRHPMLQASLYGARPQAWRFSIQPSRDPVWLVDDGSDGWHVHETLASSPFDLRAYRPLRVALVRRPDGDQLSIVAHHLAVDGISLAAIVSDIVTEYRLSDAPAATPQSVDSHVRPTVLPPVSRTSALGWAAFTRHSRRHITPMDANRGTGYGYHPLILPMPARVILGCGRRMTVNDLLVGAAHLTIDRWNRHRGGKSGTLSIRMPISPGTLAEVGGNNTGQALITTKPADRENLLKLATRIVDQTERAKQAAATPPIAGAAGKIGMAVTEWIPGSWRDSLLRWGVRTARPLITPATAVSNLGTLSNITSDDPKISSIYFTAAAGMPQGLLICVAGYDASLHITFGYHRHLFGRESASAFSHLFRTSFEELACIG